jgi:hypothetical protein
MPTRLESLRLQGVEDVRFREHKPESIDGMPTSGPRDGPLAGPGHASAPFEADSSVTSDSDDRRSTDVQTPGWTKLSVPVRL